MRRQAQTYFLPILPARLISRTSLCAPNPPLCAVAAIMVRSHEPLAMPTPGARWPGPLWVPCGLRGAPSRDARAQPIGEGKGGCALGMILLHRGG